MTLTLETLGKAFVLCSVMAGVGFAVGVGLASAAIKIMRRQS